MIQGERFKNHTFMLFTKKFLHYNQNMNSFQRKLMKSVLFAAIPAGIFYCLAIVILRLSGFGLMEIIRDPAQQTQQSSFLGFISNIGTWIWVSATTVCFFTAFLLPASFRKNTRELLILLGIFSATLAIDDFFLIHDRYIEQNICYAFYALCAGLLLVRQRLTIFKIDGVAFLLAGSLLALSILTDKTQDYIPLHYSHVQLIEEGFKFTGGAVWLYFCCLVAVQSTCPEKQV